MSDETLSQETPQRPRRGGATLATLVAFGLILWILFTVPFGLDVSAQAIVTRLGKPTRLVTEPGLHWKLPYPIESVIPFDGRLRLLKTEPMEMLTADKRNLIVEPFLIYRLEDARLFLRSVQTYTALELPLLDLLVTELGAAMGELDLSAHINVVRESVKTEEMLQRVRERLDAMARRSFGVSVVDLGVARLTFPPQNTDSVIKRMTAERDTIAAKFRSKGREEALKLEADAEARRRAILATAQEEATTLRGKADSEAARIYSKAIKESPDLYEYLRTIEAYEAILNERTTLILPHDAPILAPLLGPSGRR